MTGKEQPVVRGSASEAEPARTTPPAWGVRTAALALLVFLGCYAGAFYHIVLRYPATEASVLFLPYAVITAALLMTPVRAWWVLVLAAALGDFVPQYAVGRPVSFLMLAAVANVSRALVAAGGTRWLARDPIRLGTLRDMVAFLVFAAFLGPVVGAFVGAADVIVHNPSANFWLTVRGWFAANAIAGVTVLPLILVVVRGPATVREHFTPARALEATVLFAGLLVVAFQSFAGPPSGSGIPAGAYASLPFLLWAAVRFGPAGAVTALSAIAALAIYGALNGLGPFVAATPAANMIDLQLFLAAVSVPMLLLAASTQEHSAVLDALRKSRAQYRSVVEDQTELVCRCRPDGTYTFVNGAYCRYFRHAADELVRRANFWQFVPEEDHAATRVKLASITPQRPVMTDEYRVLAPGGEIRWQQWTIRGIFDEHGGLVEYQAVGRDVTERRRAEVALQEKEERLTLAVDAALMGLWDWDLTTGTVTWSEHMRRIHGRDVVPAEDPLESFLAVIHPEDRESVERAIVESTRRLVPYEVECRIVRPDGTERWVLASGRTFCDADGKPLRLVGLTRDLTERKRAEEQRRELESKRQLETLLRAGQERFRSLADNVPVLIRRSGLENEGVYFNQTWLDFTGRALEDELGYGWAESVHPDDRQRCLETCEAHFRRREPVTIQFRLRRHDGAYRHVLDQGVPYFAPDGEFTGYISTCVDITDRQRAEEALQDADRRKDEFLAMLGHELRNPLAPIGVAVEILRTRGLQDESVVWACDVIARQLDQLIRLVDDLLDVSRITRGTIKLNLAPLDLGRVVAEAVEASRHPMVDRDQELSVHLPSDPLAIRGDGVRLVQVISNLLNNATKYTNVGGRISLRAERCESRAILRIRDDGVGIPVEMLDRVFDMFTQVHAPGDQPQSGLGIGLTLVRQLVEMHGGSIEAHSGGPGTGSEFIVRLPLALTAPVEEAVDDEPDEIDDGDGRASWDAPQRRRILVVDDNVDAADSLSRLLRGYDHEVRVAHDGPTALTIAESMDPDVVLLDIGLPQMDGLEVARRLRRRLGGCVPLLVATTGFGQAEDRERTAAAGFDHHLTKPLDIRVLQSLLWAGPSHDGASRT